MLKGVILGVALTFGGIPFGLWPFGVMVIGAALAAGAASDRVPASARAWATGARGEIVTGRLLLPLTAIGAVVLHDRRIPRSRANIDHIVVSPAGVWIVETKNYRGAVEVRAGELRVAGRRKQAFIREALHEAETVARVIAPVPVGAIVAIHGARFPLRSIVLEGVPVIPASELVRFITTRPAIYPPDVVARLAADISRALPPKAAN